MPEPSPDKTRLRTELRQRRQALSDAQQHCAAASVAKLVGGLPGWSPARRIAIYLAADGEIDTGPLAITARDEGKQLYLPVIREDDSLAFGQWDPGSVLSPNRYGIPEPPASTTLCDPADLDIIFLPLVGWDRSGGRLGMGGGFYDRTLAGVDGPVLAGLAHSCQELALVPMEAWDVRLDYVATGTALLDCRG